jgi:uncharacterized protein (DUF697 family)
MTKNKKGIMVKPEKEMPLNTSESEARKVEPETAAKMETEEPAAASGTAVPEIPKHEVEAIIRKRVYAAMAVGLAPIPLLDLAGITAIQLEMVHALAKKYGVPFRADAVKTIVGSLVGGALPVAFAPAMASLVKFIPLIGWSAAGVTVSLLGGSVTYALGNVFVLHFESGGVLLDFDVKKFRGVFQSKVSEGKTVVSNMQKEQQAGS